MKNKFRDAFGAIKAQKEANIASINQHIERMTAIASVIKNFDGKVVNKRLETACREVAQVYLSGDYNGSKVLRSFSNLHVERDENYYYTNYKTCELILILDEDKRLNANATLNNLNLLLIDLEETLEKQMFDEEKGLNQIEQLETLEKQVEKVLELMDTDLKDHLRRYFYKLKV